MFHFFKKHYTKPTRAQLSLDIFKPYFGKTVLDVGAGGSANIFREHLGSRYKAVDVSDSRNQPDYFVDLEKERLPFKDGEFETVLCFDNLEHLENCHELMDDLIRVSSKYVIISLPNNWPTLWKSLLAGRNITHGFGYGLPPEKPIPGVRHKWFYNLEEAERFLVAGAQRNKAKVVELQYYYEHGFEIIQFPYIYPLLTRLHRDHLERFYNLSAQDQVKFGKKGMLISKTLRTLGMPASMALLYVLKLVALPFWLVDEVIKHLIWGWGSKYRYLNMFCRQIWIVIQK